MSLIKRLEQQQDCIPEVACRLGLDNSFFLQKHKIAISYNQIFSYLSENSTILFSLVGSIILVPETLSC